jgi:hypothetical protein
VNGACWQPVMLNTAHPYFNFENLNRFICVTGLRGDVQAWASRPTSPRSRTGCFRTTYPSSLPRATRSERAPSSRYRSFAEHCTRLLTCSYFAVEIRAFQNC